MNYKWLIPFLFVSILSILHSSAEEAAENKIPLGENDIPQPEIIRVDTKSGTIAGLKVKTADGNSVSVYYGIPYAQPPTGSLRFRPPKKVQPWSGVLQAMRPQPSCYQQLPGGSWSPEEAKMMRMMAQRPWSEDCLHLNIWAPDPKADKVPVIFFIHGGAFILGSGIWLADGTYFASEGVVVVTINYRLGAFGFLNLGQSDAPGNVGLMDQNLALQWVKDNIESFGGDSDRITITGMSAGSASVGYHLLSPKSRGLFARAIMMSGAPTNWWAVLEPEDSVAISKKLLDYLGCLLPNVTASLECARKKHPEDILDGVRTETLTLDTNLIPTIDGDFIVEHPAVSVASSRFNPGELLIGTTSDEGGAFISQLNPNLFKTNDGRLFRRNLKKVIKESYKGLTNLQIEALGILYTNWTSPDDPIMLRDAAIRLYTDALFDCHVSEFADSVAKTESAVYRYVFNYRLDFFGLFIPRWVGVTHGSDQVAILISPAFAKQFLNSRGDFYASRKYRRHYINFAKSGNPNLDKDEFPGEPEWPRYDANKQNLWFSTPSTVGPSRRPRECAVWLNLLPLLAQKDNC